MKPKDVKHDRDLPKLKRGYASTVNAWILFNHANELVIAKQKQGESPIAVVCLTRRDFQKFVDWWEGK